MSHSLRQRADLLAVLLAREITDNSVVVMGTGTPLTAVATLLAINHHAPNAFYTSPLAGGLSVGPHDLSLAGLERAVYDNAVLRSAQIIDLWEFATINPKVADRWLQFFRPAQIDPHGNMNNSVIGNYHHPRVRLPGSVGISDMAAYYPNLYAYVTRHNTAALLPKVDFVSSIGTVGNVEQRESRGLRWGRPYKVFTDLCVLGFDEAGRMVIESMHPGVEFDDVQAATGFPIAAGTQHTTEPPDSTELAALDHVDPTSLRQLELLSSRERRAAIRSLLSRTQTDRCPESLARTNAN